MASGGADGQVVIRELPHGDIAATLRRHDGVAGSTTGAGAIKTGVCGLAMGAKGVLYSAGADGALFELQGIVGAAGPASSGALAVRFHTNQCAHRKCS